MKKNNKLKKIVIIVLIVALVAGVVAFVLGRNDDADEITLVDIPIITYFGVTNSSTTPEDIIAVERDLNNVLITDGYAVKLFLAPEERYETMISSAKTMMDAYMENNKKTSSEKLGFEYKFDYATSTFEFKCDADAKTPAVVYNQDTIIEMLDDGKEIYPNVPSIDVMLVTDYDNYFEMAQNGEFTRLNSSLTDIAKSLKQSIPNAFFEALKLNNSGDIYGVPSVQVVGEYEFMVYDKDLLTKYNVSKNQLLSVEDLDSYLKTVANDAEVDVIPLLNAPQSSPLELSDGKSIGITFNGALDLPFRNDDYMAYYATIARYRSLGYMGEVGADIESSDFAVAFFSGTEDEVKALAEKTGKNLVYNKFSMPYATSTEVGAAVFCICAEKKYSVSKSDFGIDFVCKLNAPKSQTDIKNILLYGALGINYAISETDGNVEYANGNTYSMENLYTGHTLHAHHAVDKGVNAEWIASAQAHNLDLVVSKLSGFKFETNVYSVDGLNGESFRIAGPDYLAVMDNIVSSIYSDYINGISGAVDLDDFNARVDDLIRADIANEVQKLFEASEEKRMSVTFEEQIRADEAWMATKTEEAASSSLFDLKETVKAELTAELTVMYNSLGVTDAEEIATRLNKDITDELIEERLNKNYTEQEIKEAAEAKLNSYIAGEIAVKIAEYRRTEAYAATVNAYINSAEFNAIVAERFEDERDEAYFEVLDSEIEDKLFTFSEEIVTKIDAAIIEANAKFIADNKDKVSEKELSEITLCAGFSELLDNMLRSQYYDLKGEPK